jgi:hypothetical protein
VKPGKEQFLPKRDIERLTERLLFHPAFVAGPQGTLLAFGSNCDLFRTPRLADQFLFALKLVAPLGNPLQISTKHFIRPQWAEAIAATVTYEMQIVVFVSCATIFQSRVYEPYTAPPSRRFQSFTSLRPAGIPSCLFIKPFLPGITDQDSGEFIAVVHRMHPGAVCIGSLFLNQQILPRLCLPTLASFDSSVHHPLMQDGLGAVRPRQAFVDTFQQSMPEIPIFQSSLCVVAHVQGNQCPLHGIAKCLPNGAGEALAS